MNASVLRMKRVMPAPATRVFAAWASGEAMSRWFVVEAEWTAKASCDLRVGGKYRVEMSDGDRVVGVASGEYLEIDPPRRLVFTWSTARVEASVVTIELRESGTSTELTLTHDLAPESEAGRRHTYGWEGSLTSLDRYLRGAKPGAQGNGPHENGAPANAVGEFARSAKPRGGGVRGKAPHEKERK